jgi:hypothetical protein
MLIVLRRFLAIAALMFWQGGFTFYAAVVVPIGQWVLGSHLEQGLITREVTWYLNVSGAFAIGILAIELQSSGVSRQLQLKWRWAIWGGMALVLFALVIMHPAMDALIDANEHTITDRVQFRIRHRIYLWVSTLEWILGIAYLWLMLKSWTGKIVEK